MTGGQGKGGPKLARGVEGKTCKQHLGMGCWVQCTAKPASALSSRASDAIQMLLQDAIQLLLQDAIQLLLNAVQLLVQRVY